MDTLQILDGDLVIAEGGRYSLLSGQAKLVQDLSLAVEEPYGCDPYHPRWGSLLPTYVGMPNSGEAELLITSEIKRLISNYMTVKTAKIKAQAAAGLTPSIKPDEMVQSIVSIKVVQQMDTFYVKVVLETFANTQQVLALVVS